MPPPNPLAGGPEDFTDADWYELAANWHPGGGDHFTGDGDGEAVLVAKVSNAKLPGCLRYCLGYSAVDNQSPYSLSRKLPVKHPRWQELICTAAHGHPFKPKGDVVNPVMGRRAVKKYVAAAPNVGTFSGYSNYELSRVTLRFEAKPWEAKQDGETLLYQQSPGGQYSFRSEWKRFTEIEVAPTVEQLSLDGFVLIYAEGTGTAHPVTSPQGRAFPAPFAQLLVKADIVVRTHRLPEDFLFTENSFRPRNVLYSLGKVNKYAWNSMPAGTLLHTATKLTRRRWGLRLSGESQYLWTAEHYFNYFNPTKGVTGGSATQITTNLGHNNMPYRGAVDENGAILTGDTNAGKWFYATRSGNASDAPLLESFDIAQLWRSVRDKVHGPDGTELAP